MPRKRKRRNVIVAVMRGNHETRHRGPTLRAALRVAERERVPAGCRVEWYYGRHKGAAPPLKKRGRGRAASVLLDGEVFCPGSRRPEPIYGTVIQGRRFRAWWLRQKYPRAK